MFILREKPFLHPALALNRTSQPVLSSPRKRLNQDSCTQGTLRCSRSRVHLSLLVLCVFHADVTPSWGTRPCRRSLSPSQRSPTCQDTREAAAPESRSPNGWRRFTLRSNRASSEKHALVSIDHCREVFLYQTFIHCCVFSISLCCSEYLEVHQTELDKLMSLMKDMKRNSRLVKTLAQELTAGSLAI